MICLATAHPAKFPAEVAQALPNVSAPLPEHMEGLFEREERYTVLENEIIKVQGFVQDHLQVR